MAFSRSARHTDHVHVRDSLARTSARLTAAADATGRSLGWSRRAVVRLAFAAAASVAATVLVLAKVADDVSEHNDLTTHDASWLHFFVAHRSTAVVDAAKVMTDIGTVGVLLVVALVAGVLLRRRGVPLEWALAPVVSLLVTGVLVDIGKRAFGRARPPVALHLARETNASFPSGHSADGTATYLAIALVVAIVVLRRPAARAVAVVGGVVLAGLIGTSRLVLGVHWPTDVVAGFALGSTVAVTTVAALTAATASGLRVAPLRRDRGQGVGTG
jgi:undecaprenyl-diphosphatase